MDSEQKHSVDMTQEERAATFQQRLARQMQEDQDIQRLGKEKYLVDLERLERQRRVEIFLDEVEGVSLLNAIEKKGFAGNVN